RAREGARSGLPPGLPPRRRPRDDVHPRRAVPALPHTLPPASAALVSRRRGGGVAGREARVVCPAAVVSAALRPCGPVREPRAGRRRAPVPALSQVDREKLALSGAATIPGPAHA